MNWQNPITQEAARSAQLLEAQDKATQLFQAVEVHSLARPGIVTDPTATTPPGYFVQLIGRSSPSRSKSSGWSRN